MNFLLYSNTAILRPLPTIIDFPIPQVLALPVEVAIVPPILVDSTLSQIKTTEGKGGKEIAVRKECKSRKDAYEKAKRSGKGKEPRHDPSEHEKNKKPHYHPYESHDHYYYTHTVVKGDTLSEIAIRYGTSVKKIAVDNKISDPNKIYKGQVLKIK